MVTHFFNYTDKSLHAFHKEMWIILYCQWKKLLLQKTAIKILDKPLTSWIRVLKLPLTIYFHFQPSKNVLYNIIPGFDSFFQKLFVSFPNENNRKTDLEFCAPWLLDEENFEIYQIRILL